MCVAQLPSIPELNALFDARCALEGKSAVEAASKINEEQLAHLEQLYDEMLLPNSKPIEYHLINRNFHLQLYQISEWNHAVVCITHMLDQVFSYFSLYASRIQLDFSEFNKEHRLILDAIRLKNLEQVSTVIIKNINRGRKFMTSLMKFPSAGRDN